MRYALAALAFLMITFAMQGPALADPLDGLRGEKRVLLLFSKSRSLAALDRQVDRLRDFRAEMEERKMVVLVTAGSDPTYSAIGYSDVPRNTNRELAQRFNAQGSGLTVVLVGLDGAEKARWTSMVDPQEIFALVDAMPMRRRELGEG